METRGLCRSFADREAVRGLDLQVTRGEVFGLLGPNGAGKTTTMRILTTLLPPSAGTATVCGFDVVADAEQVRGQLGYVMQQVPARWNMTGREILQMEAALCHVPRREVASRAREALAVTGMERAADRLFQHYSGGMQKRLDIACALVHRPRLLVLDEPTLGLDVLARHQVWRQIRTLSAQDVTVLLATNYLDEAEQLCDRLMIIDEGATVVVGRPEELTRAVGCDVLRIATGQLDTASEALRNRWWAQRVLVGADAVHVHVDDAALRLPEVLAVVVAAGVTVSRVTYTRPTLDDVFLLHTGNELMEAR